MTEERIEQLRKLLSHRIQLQNEVEAFERIFSIDQRDRGFEICNTSAPRESSFVHFIKDHYGYIDDALHKIQKSINQDLEIINKEIEEF